VTWNLYIERSRSHVSVLDVSTAGTPVADTVSVLKSVLGNMMKIDATAIFKMPDQANSLAASMGCMLRINRMMSFRLIMM